MKKTAYGPSGVKTDPDPEPTGSSLPPGPDRKPGAMCKHYRKLFVIPFVFILASVVIMSVANYLDPPKRKGDYDDWQKEMDDFNDTVEDVRNTADMIFTIAVLMLGFLFFTGAFIDKRLPDSVRIAMMVLGTAILIFFMGNGIELQAVLG